MTSQKTNKKLWQNYEDYASVRGRLVAHILSDYISIPHSKILDFGCGTGGISLELGRMGAQVTSFDVNQRKLAVLGQNLKIEQASIKIVDELPGTEHEFDAVILLDVVEHLVEPGQILSKLNKLLKPEGVIYLSTPNKYSPFNMLIDPHFSLPIVSLLKRQHVKKVLADWLKWQPKDRIDFPELMTLRALNRLMKQHGFDWSFVNSQVARFAFEYPQSVWNRDAHLEIIKKLKDIGLTDMLSRLISNKVDVFNLGLNPTWYMMAQKKPDSTT